MSDALAWEDIIDRCSRLHTTRTRRAWPSDDAPIREASRMMDATADGRPIQIVPTRMHEPGLYWRYMDVPAGEGTMRAEDDIEQLHRLADAGLVHGRDGRRGEDG